MIVLLLGGRHPTTRPSTHARLFRKLDQQGRVGEKLSGEFDETAARNLFLTEGLDGKPHQLTAQLLLRLLRDLSFFQEFLEAQKADIAVASLLLTHKCGGVGAADVTETLQSPRRPPRS